MVAAEVALTNLLAAAVGNSEAVLQMTDSWLSINVSGFPPFHCQREREGEKERERERERERKRDRKK